MSAVAKQPHRLPWALWRSNRTDCHGRRGEATHQLPREPPPTSGTPQESSAAMRATRSPFLTANPGHGSYFWILAWRSSHTNCHGLRSEALTPTAPRPSSDVRNPPRSERSDAGDTLTFSVGKRVWQDIESGRGPDPAATPSPVFRSATARRWSRRCRSRPH